MNEKDSKAIEFLRFPLICAVVCIHTNLIEYCDWLTDFPVFSNSSYIFISILCSIAVPLFFFISGYLFFKTQDFNEKIYIDKIKRRIISLFVPYILWNIIYFMIVCLFQIVKPDFQLLLHKSIYEMSLTDFLYIFWDISKISHLPTDQNAPLVTQFWFLQCLMIIILLSPIIYVGIKRLKVLFILLMAIICVTDILPEYTGVKWGAFFYFILGSYFSVNKISIIAFSRIIAKYNYIISIVLFICLFYSETFWFLFNISLIFIIFHITSMITDRKKMISATVVSSSFFIFAVHRFFTAIFTSIARYKIIPLNSEIAAFLYYIIGTTICIACCFALYVILKKYLPKTTSLLIGGRLTKQ